MRLSKVFLINDSCECLVLPSYDHTRCYGRNSYDLGIIINNAVSRDRFGVVVIWELLFFTKYVPHGRGYIVRIEGSMGHAMHQLDDVPIFDDVDGLVHGKVLPFWPFDDPPIIDVLFSNRVLLG